MENVKNLSDEDLVELVRRSNQELYTEIVRRYQNKLLRYADSLVGDHHQAADVVQEAFIKAFVNLRGFNVKKNFSSWIYRIVHNEAINQIRRSKKKVSLDGSSYLRETLKSKADVEKDFSRKEIKSLINDCLDELPLKYRAPLVLFYLEERSYEEISDVLKIPLGTVGTRINRGKKVLVIICKKNPTLA
jgi:RNA polymerase sigma-70 factor (ECF subfamily)